MLKVEGEKHRVSIASLSLTSSESEHGMEVDGFISVNTPKIHKEMVEHKIVAVAEKLNSVYALEKQVPLLIKGYSKLDKDVSRLNEGMGKTKRTSCWYQ